MCLMHYYEDKLEEAIQDLVTYYRKQYTKEDAFKKVNKTISEKTHEIKMNEKDD